MAWAALALALAGCGGDSGVSTKELDQDIADASPVFKPTAGELPFPSDLTRNGSVDGSVNIPVVLDTDGDGQPDTQASNVDSAIAPQPQELADPQVALNTMDGFGTTSAISVSFSNPIDPQTLKGNIRVFKPADSCGGSCNVPKASAPPTNPLGINLGVDVATKTIVAVGEELQFGTDFIVNNAGNSGALILPMQPLEPGETFLVVVTNGVKSTTGKAVSPSEEYELTKSTSPVNDPTLESIRPQVNQHEQAVADFTATTPSAEDDLEKPEIALSFSFTTENVGGALQNAKAQVDGAGTAPGFNIHNEDDEWATSPDLDGDGNPGDYAVVSPGADGEVNAQGDHAARIYLGTVNDAIQFVDPTIPNDALWQGNTSAWQSTGETLDGNGDNLDDICGDAYPTTTESDNLVPCNAFTPAVQEAAHDIPVLVSAPRPEILGGSFDIPNDGSSETYDCSAQQGSADGLPVVVFQHGITTSRATTMAIADTLAKACIVGVAIDLPKHGILPTNEPFGRLASLYQLLQGDDGDVTSVTQERLVTVSDKDDCQDPDNATGVDPANPDSAPFYCPSGDRYINLENLANARDTYRQGIVDLFTLLRALQENTPIPDHVGANIDETNIHFAGMSLGAITGVPFVNMASADIGTATFNVGGGGIAKILDGSPQFEPRITGGLAERGVIKPSSSYEGFMLIAQTLFDNADPMNFASDVAGTTPVLFHQVVGETQVVNSDCASVNCPDQVVPNNVFGQTVLTESWNAITGSDQISHLPGQNPLTQPVALAGTDPLTQGTGFLALSQQGATDPLSTAIPGLFYGLNLPEVGSSGASGSAGVVRFTAGGHGSFLDPSTNQAVTSVMQKQLAAFILSGGGFVAGTENPPAAAAPLDDFQAPEAAPVVRD